MPSLDEIVTVWREMDPAGRERVRMGAHHLGNILDALDRDTSGEQVIDLDAHFRWHVENNPTAPFLHDRDKSQTEAGPGNVQVMKVQST